MNQNSFQNRIHNRESCIEKVDESPKDNQNKPNHQDNHDISHDNNHVEKFDNAKLFHKSNTIFYIPNFVPTQVSDTLRHYINHSVKYTKLMNRELVSFGPTIASSTTPVYLSLSVSLPSFMQNIIDSLHLNDLKKQLSLQRLPSKLNHILLNRYQVNQGITAHRDGPAYDPFVFIISLESPIRLDFFLDEIYLETLDKDEQLKVTNRIEEEEIPKQFSIILDLDSLIIFQEIVYQYYKHEIKETDIVHFSGAINEEEMIKKYGVNQLQRSQRSSLTIRTVKHVNSKVNRLFPGLNKRTI